jgi:flagella basal body P-ring formation protein FlgA
MARVLLAALAAACLWAGAAPAQMGPDPAAQAAAAGTVVASRPIRVREIIGPDDVRLNPGATPGGLSDVDLVIGQEARVGIFAGWPIRPGDIGPPALVDRNQLVTLVFRRGGLNITADGRALGRAAAGELVRVMNMSSRATVTGVVTGPNVVEVR